MLAPEADVHDLGADPGEQRDLSKQQPEVAARLKLASVDLSPDERRRTFGRHLDHLLLRGLEVVQAHSPEVTSSDHNPVLVTLTAP